MTLISPPSPETSTKSSPPGNAKSRCYRGGELTYGDGRAKWRAAEAWNLRACTLQGFDLIPTVSIVAGELGFFTTDAQKAAYGEKAI